MNGDIFQPGDIFTTTGVAATASRLNFRYHCMFEPIAKLFSNATILEFGSHNGRWSYVSLMLGAKRVIGIEQNKKYIDLANRILCDKGIDKGSFKFHNVDCMDFNEVLDEQPDIVLCMGVLYYLQKPFQLISKIRSLQPKLCVIDTFHSRRKVPMEAKLDEFLKSEFIVTKLARYDKGARVSYHCKPHISFL